MWTGQGIDKPGHTVVEANYDPLEHTLCDDSHQSQAPVEQSYAEVETNEPALSPVRLYQAAVNLEARAMPLWSKFTDRRQNRLKLKFEFEEYIESRSQKPLSSQHWPSQAAAEVSQASFVPTYTEVELK